MKLLRALNEENKPCNDEGDLLGTVHTFARTLTFAEQGIYAALFVLSVGK